MINHKDSFAYKLYRQAEENLEQGTAANNLLELITKDILKSVDFGKDVLCFDTSEHYNQVIDEVVSELKNLGFKAFRETEDELFILWDFSEEDAKEEGNNESI